LAVGSGRIGDTRMKNTNGSKMDLVVQERARRGDGIVEDFSVNLTMLEGLVCKMY
jgi:hypothetical protein